MINRLHSAMVTTAATTALVCVFLIPQDSSPSSIKPVVSCNRLSICDSKGNERIAGFVGSDNVARQVICSSDGRKVCDVWGGDDGRAGITLMGGGLRRVEVSLERDGSVGITLCDGKGEGRLIATTAREGTSTVMCLDPKGFVRASANVLDGRLKGTLAARDGGVMELSIADGNVPRLSIADGSGKQVWLSK